MHFTFDISLGQVITVLTILGAGWRFDKVLAKYLFEHELLVQDYCERQGIDVSKLPTRSRS